MKNIRIYFVLLWASLAMNGSAMELEENKRQGDPSPRPLCQALTDSSANSLLALPTEVIANIFSLVPLEDFIRLGQVGKLF